MVKETSRLGLNDYEEGDTNWDHSDTVGLFDELAIERGPINKRSEEGDYNNELYFATDTDERALYRWDTDASEWVVELVAPENIGAADLGFDPATQEELDTELSTHRDADSAHHSRYTDDEVEEVVKTLIRMGYGKRPYGVDPYGFDI